MALRSEDLYGSTYGRDARIVRFPSTAVQQARARRLRRQAQTRRRALATAVMFVLAIALFVLATGPEGNVQASRRTPKAITLQAGQTLWDVAERYAPAGEDPRAYVDALIELNSVDGVAQAGQRIKLPR